jgi:hypothetical protein
MKLKLFVTSFTFALMTLVFSSSCEKKTDCKLIIKTQKENGSIVSGANIKLYANVKTSSGSIVEADLKAEGVSDASGSVSFTFKLPAILDVKAVSDTLEGVGVIKLEEGKTVDKTVIMK